MTAKLTYTPDQIVQQLIGWGWHWDQPTVTYHVGNADAAQQSYLREATALWDDVSDLDIVKTADPSTADIGFDYWASPTDVFWEDADPASLTIREVGIHYSANDSWNQGQNLSYGSYGFTVMLHEIGHALGLSHPGDYGRDQGDKSTYTADAEFQQDTHRYTLMSYFGAHMDGSGTSHSFFNGTGFQWVFPQTPMVYDILALEALYGAEATTRTDDTVYGYNATANRDVFDFTQNPSPVLTLYDNGGVDTLDLSGDTAERAVEPVYAADGSVISWQDASVDYVRVIDLREGAYSSTHGMTANIGIAYGSVIENAVGTAYADIIRGNGVANELSGNGGNDSIYGYAGDDILFGSGGDDRLFGGADHDYLHGKASTDRLAGHAGNDRMQGGAGSDIVLGGEGDDRLFGGPDHDKLKGGAGNDRLLGEAGNDRMWGGSGIDTFVFQPDDGSDKVRDFENGLDILDFSSFGFDTKSAVLDLAAQSGADVVFMLPDEATVTLSNFDIAHLGGEDLLI